MYVRNCSRGFSSYRPNIWPSSFINPNRPIVPGDISIASNVKRMGLEAPLRKGRWWPLRRQKPFLTSIMLAAIQQFDVARRLADDAVHALDDVGAG